MMQLRSLMIVMLLALGSACSGDTEEKATTAPVQQAVSDPIIGQLNQKLAEAPNDPSLYFERAKRYYENQGYDEAILDAQQAIKLDSSQVDYYHLLADVFLDYYKSRKALQTMETAADRFPENAHTLLKLSEFQLILEQHENSMRTLDKLLKQDPNNAEAYFMFGANFKDLKDTVRAINSFQSAVEYEPELIDAWINLGQLHAGLGNKIAERYFDSALLVEPENVEALHAKAFYLQEQGELNGSLEMFRRIARVDPQYEDAYYNAGLLYLDMDSLQNAYQQFDLALKISPLHIRSYYYRGVAAELLGNTTQARQDYEQALRLAPDYVKPQEGLARLAEEE